MNSKALNKRARMIDRNNVADVYVLSPLQEGILFHHIMSGVGEADAYIVQVVLTLGGSVDVSLLEQSIAEIIEKYDIFRTVYTYKQTKRPRQVVLKKVDFKVAYEDISHLEETRKAGFMDDFRTLDKKRGFNLSGEPPLRVALIRLSAARCHMVWSFHHIAMDGWCMGIIFKELTAVYLALKKGESLKSTPAAPYKNYILWLENQDKEKGMAFWREYLSGYEHAAALPKRERVQRGDHDYDIMIDWRFVVDEELTSRLAGMAKANQVTMNTILQTIWGILLLRYNNCNDVVFGVVAANRPGEIEDVEEMVGLFINTVPFRITVTEDTLFSRLAKTVQRRALLSRAYEYLPLAEIQASSTLKQRLIDHIMAFENYPLEEKLREQWQREEIGFEIEDAAFYNRSHYDFTVMIGPGRRLVVRFNYNPSVYQPDVVEKAAQDFMQIVNQVAANPDVRLTDIRLSHELIAAEAKVSGSDFTDFGF